MREKREKRTLLQSAFSFEANREEMQRIMYYDINSIS